MTIPRRPRVHAATKQYNPAGVFFMVPVGISESAGSWSYPR